MKRFWLDATAVFVVALIARVVLIEVGGGFLRTPGYDASVYYTAADAFAHGRLPYRDFTLLHPPGLMLALSPFASLGRITSDGFGYGVARAVFVVLGALNAVLVVRIARRLEVTRGAALAGGVFYALCFDSVLAARATRLEPLGSSLLLLALLVAIRSRSSRGPVQRWEEGLAGACMGAAAMVKIWGILPVLMVLGWLLVGPDGRRRAARFAGGAAAAMVLIGGPFFLAAPRQMWRMVVLDQLGRRPSGIAPLRRLGSASGILAPFPGSHPASYGLAVICFGGLATAVLVSAWLLGRGRVIVVLAVLQLTVLFGAPSFFPWYVEFVAPVFAVCVALAASGVSGLPARGDGRVDVRRWLRPLAWALAAGAGLVTVIGLGSGLEHPASQPVLAPITSAVARMRCVMSDDPGLMIELNLTSRDLADGCPNWVDVTGRTYEPRDRPSAGGRRGDRRWQVDLRRYLTAGQAVIAIRPLTGMNRATVRIVQSGSLLAADSQGVRLFAVTPLSRCLARHSSLHHLAITRCRAAQTPVHGG